MTQGEFEREMHRADVLRRLTPLPEETAYFEGLQRGLRRAYHGEKFGTVEEHDVHMNIPEDEPDVMRRARGRGYRAGLKM